MKKSTLGLGAKATLGSKLNEFIGGNGFIPEQGETIYVWSECAEEPPVALEFLAMNEGRYVCKANEYLFSSWTYAARIKQSVDAIVYIGKSLDQGEWGISAQTAKIKTKGVENIYSLVKYLDSNGLI